MELDLHQRERAHTASARVNPSFAASAPVSTAAEVTIRSHMFWTGTRKLASSTTRTNPPGGAAGDGLVEGCPDGVGRAPRQRPRRSGEQLFHLRSREQHVAPLLRSRQGVRELSAHGFAERSDGVARLQLHHGLVAVYVH
jgi:ribosomal protein L31